MRTLLLAAALLPLSLIAQTTFAPIGAKWSYKVNYAFINDSALLQLESIGDTVLQGTTCRVLEINMPIFCIQKYRYVRASNDTVFFWEPMTSSFSTLFIANAVPGQQWTTAISDITFQVTGSATVTVTDTFTTVIDGLSLRSMEVDVAATSPFYYFGATITERLGGSGYLFPWLGAICDGDYISSFRCYEDPDISWLNANAPECDLITGFAEASEPMRWSLTPNLIEQNTAASLRCIEPGLEWDLLDAQGRIVASGIAVVGRTEIPITQPGGYLLLLSREGAILGRERITVH